jgi:hypothetical protein
LLYGLRPSLLSAIVIVQPDTIVRRHRERFRLYWRWSGSVRRECLDHAIVLGEGHLSTILKLYADYQNRVANSKTRQIIAPPIRTGPAFDRFVCRLERYGQRESQ